MGDASDIKPWFRDDLARTLMSIYFSSKCSQRSVGGAQPSADAYFAEGFAAALSSVALAVGVNPESFLAPEDVQLLRKDGG